jgi:hypothetical protein
MKKENKKIKRSPEFEKSYKEAWDALWKLWFSSKKSNNV